MRPWWQDGVIYQIYPRSYADSNADGIGDLEGIRSKLDYLEWLGVDGLWLNPINPSPNKDWGYDVSDYRDVHPDLGDMATLERLVEEAGERGIRILLDIVPNHSSDRHPWFADSRSSREARYRDWYVWADGKDGRAAEQLAERLRRADLDASTRRQASGTCTTSCRNSPTSTGGRTRSGTRSTTFSVSGSTGASPASASTSRTGSSTTRSSATTRPTPRRPGGSSRCTR